MGIKIKLLIKKKRHRKIINFLKNKKLCINVEGRITDILKHFIETPIYGVDTNIDSVIVDI